MGLTEVDVAVVGAGPAGSAAALAALRRRLGARVLLIDRARFPRDKTCGDGVAPHALDVLAALGVADPGRGYPQVEVLELGRPRSGGHAVARRMARPTVVVPRLVLDDRVRRAALAAGAIACCRAVRALRLVPGGVLIDGEVHARVVVGADGVHSVVRRALGLPAHPDGHRAIAIRGYAPLPDPVRAMDPRGADLAAAGRQRIVFADTGWPAYAWSFPVGGGSANIGYGEVLRPGHRLTRAHLLERLEELLPRAADGVRGLRAAYLPLSSGRPGQPDGRVLLAGDAAGLVNPMTGEGIYYAVLSGRLAGEAAADSLADTRMSTGQSGTLDPGRQLRSTLARALGRHLRHTTTATRLARAPIVVDAALRAAVHRQQVFDDLVELGLGDGLLRPRTLLALAATGVDRSATRAGGRVTRSRGPGPQ
ncbi:MAG: NAD(P)/FAD-dependent oxidoreductase [Angustibacter sp.]